MDHPHGATNAIRELDGPVDRPGRIDLMLPISPPDDEARAAARSHLVGSIDRFEADAADFRRS